MDEIARIKRLAGLCEAEEYLDPDTADDMRIAELDAQDEREKRVVALIVSAFVKLGLPLDYDFGRGSQKVYKGVYYDESSDREARVELEDTEIGIQQLAGLLQSGLGSDYRITSRGDGLEVIFTVDATLDHAVI